MSALLTPTAQTPPPDHPVRQRRKEARPGEIAAAAIEVFIEKGFAATRLDDIAARAGVSKGTVYLYFDGKEALFKAAVEAGIIPALQEGEALLAENGYRADALLREFMRRWWNLIGETPLGGLPKLMLAEVHNFPDIAAWYHERVILRAMRLMGAIIERGIAQGVFRPVPIESAIHVVFAPMLMLLLWRHGFACCGAVPMPAPLQHLDNALDILIHGLAVPTAPGAQA